MRYIIVAILLFLNIQILSSNEVKKFFINCDISDFNYIYENYEEDHYIPVELEVDGKVWTNVEMRIRGDDSRDFPKKSLKLKFNDELFFDGRDRINFNAEYTDPTYMRQFLCSYLFRETGHPCFKSEQVRLYLNGEYFGIYLMVENVDPDFLTANNLDPIGNLYKATHDGACLTIFDGVYAAWEKKTNEHLGRDDLQQLIDSLEYVKDNEYYEFCKETFDYDKMLNIIALNMLLANGSTYYHNYYMYHDIHNSGKWIMLPWDMDKTFIGYSKYFPYHSTNQIWIHDNPFVERAIADKSIMEDLKLKLKYLSINFFNNDYLDPIIDRLSVTLYESVANDTTINIESMDVYYEHIAALKDFIKDRYQMLMSQINSLPSNFRVHRLRGLQSGGVTISWERSVSPLGNDVSYILYLSQSMSYPEGGTVIITDIQDTTFTFSSLENEGKWYYRVEATDGKNVMPGFDDFNNFLYQIGHDIPCDIYEDYVITKEISPAYVNCHITVHEGASLVFEPGAEIWFADSTAITCLNDLQSRGTKEEPVIIKPSGIIKNGLKIYLFSSKKPCNIDYMISEEVTIHSEHSYFNLSNSTFSSADGISHLGKPSSFVFQISKDLKVDSCVFYGNNKVEGVVSFWAYSKVSNSKFYHIPDAVSYAPCDSGLIEDNVFYNSPDDAIDLNGCKNVEIIGNVIANASDKGISLGMHLERHGENLFLSRNIISGCKIGIALKTTKNIDIINNTFYGNQIAVSSSIDSGETITTEAKFLNTVLASSVVNDLYLDSLSDITFSYCMAEDTLLEGSNNIKADPLFVDPQNNDFRLQPDSPCINAGDPQSPKDPDGSRADIGAIPYLQQQGILINEICYNPSDDRNCGDWVEFYNPTDYPVEMGDWYFSDENDDNIFVFPSNFRLLPESYVVLSNDIANFKIYYPEVSNVIGEFDFGFSGSGEMLRLYNSDSELIDYVLYDDKEPWPTKPDGDGPTLELISFELDNALPESWKSSEDYGTPGRKNSEPSSIVEYNAMTDDISLSAYPNPVDNFLHLSIQCRKNTQYSLYLVNQLGQRAELQNKNFLNPGKNDINIDLSNYSNGVYYLIFETLLESRVVMVVKR